MSIHKPKPVRFTFDMIPGMHHRLKVVCTEDGVSMNAFVTKAIENEFAAREERVDEKAVDQAKEDARAHGTISLEDMDKAIGV